MKFKLPIDNMAHDNVRDNLGKLKGNVLIDSCKKNIIGNHSI